MRMAPLRARGRPLQRAPPSAHKHTPPRAQDFTGGIAWYAAQLHGAGAPKELFYVDPALKGYYKSYVAKVINRTNSVNGRAYKDDPAVLAWEVRAGRGGGAAARSQI